MNPTVNRSSESPSPKSDRSEPLSTRKSQSPSPDAGESTRNHPSTPADLSPVTLTVPVRNHPIPPPSDPRQYRAIGLVRGCYQPSEESLTRGTLNAVDGTPIDAVLLGRAIGVVKNHLDLSAPHLWVVYPRTRQEGDLHVQIVGVWEPEVLGTKSDRAIDSAEAAQPEAEANAPAQTEPEAPVSSESTEASSESAEPEPTLALRDGYFSIRGEAVFYAKEDEKLIIKVQQAPRKEADRSRYFKLTLKGVAPTERVLGHFWDVQVMLQGNTLAIEEATDIGTMPIKKRKPGEKKKPFSRNNSQGRRPPGKFPRREGSLPERPTPPRDASKAPPRPVPKPIKPARNPQKNPE
ncbi:hypothetical protein [Oscillatoria sp. FACHB-1406]|uniref:hypothetical protein n=1 Tax=Oscillatoria sp. FACHB-1406 TaxID=2692846 RepID=UPI0016897659|nr:hypothetical protein [Oscillatoria sp. FACHB-1406]MBD2578629.1 hypothetical protein [Oscillatoria sp. FACHB-1406]